MSVFLLGAFCFVNSARAEDMSRPVFFTAIPDLPIMDGLHELPDQTVMFDKAEGRIIESVAAIDSHFDEEVRSYYLKALPQLGWVPHEAGVYMRGSERLQMNFEQVEDERFLRVRISPQ